MGHTLHTLGLTFDDSAPARDPVEVSCGDCQHEWAVAFAPLAVDALVKALQGARCPACGSRAQKMGRVPRPTPAGEAEAWLHNGDTGTSSETIWAVMIGRPPRPGFTPGAPRDPDDFGRCYRLLQVMPAWRARLSEVAARYPEWHPLVAAWDELTALYEAEVPDGLGSAPGLYLRMRALRHEAERLGRAR